MEGYKRSEEMTEALVVALSEALKINPEQRLGQMIYNLTRNDRLFVIHDETMLNRLKDVGYS